MPDTQLSPALPQRLEVQGIGLHVREDGQPDGAPIVFSNSLGTDLRLWDGVVAHLPPGLRIIRYDKRGHGLSDCPAAPYTMGALVKDLEGILDALGVQGALVVGLSIGGMIAQGLAAKRLDLVRALVLSNTGAKIATRAVWDARIDAVKTGGMAAVTEATMERWFSRRFHASPEHKLWQTMFERTPPEGWIGCGAAISGTDFMASTSALRLPTLGIAGDEDGSTPPDLVRETVGLVPGSRVALMTGCGHVPCVEDPARYSEILTTFLRETGHI